MDEIRNSDHKWDIEAPECDTIMCEVDTEQNGQQIRKSKPVSATQWVQGWLELHKTVQTNN